MPYTCFLLAALLVPVLLDDDLSTLIDQLGSPRFSTRESAQQSLLELGARVIPLLHTAQEHRDLEVKARATTILHEVESRLVLEPVRIERWTHPISLGAVVEALSQSGGRPIRLDQVKGLEHAQVAPLPLDVEPSYWNVVRHLEQSCGVRAVSVMEGEDDETTVSACLTLVASRRSAPGFVKDQGPFRTKLLSANVHKNQNFEPTLGEMEEPEAFRVFTLQLQVMSEPRLILFATSGVRLELASDELGHSLIKREHAPGELAGQLPIFESPLMLLDGGSGPCLTTTMELALPEQPGRLVQKLKGTIPLTVLQRRSTPLQITLNESAGRSYENGSFRLAIKSVELAPVDAQPSVEIELSTRENTDSALASLVHGPGMNLAQLLEHLCEVVDSQGKPMTVVPIEIDEESGSIRMRLAILPSDPSRKPVRLAFYDAIVASQDIPFEFQDVPIP